MWKAYRVTRFACVQSQGMRKSISLSENIYLTTPILSPGVRYNEASVEITMVLRANVFNTSLHTCTDRLPILDTVKGL